jgi:hypothetical protein
MPVLLLGRLGIDIQISKGDRDVSEICVEFIHYMLVMP